MNSTLYDFGLVLIGFFFGGFVGVALNYQMFRVWCRHCVFKDKPEA